MTTTAIEEKRIAIYFTDEECELIKTFLQYQDEWKEIFRIRNGSAELHFDSQGKLLKVGYYKFKKLSTDE